MYHPTAPRPFSNSTSAEVFAVPSGVAFCRKSRLQVEKFHCSPLKTTSQNHGQIAGCENQLRSGFYSKLSHLTVPVLLFAALMALRVFG
jgi:hypothetical protein